MRKLNPGGQRALVTDDIADGEYTVDFVTHCRRAAHAGRDHHEHAYLEMDTVDAIAVLPEVWPLPLRIGATANKGLGWC